MTNYAIITAAGIGKRMQCDKNKVFLMIDEEPVILRTLRVFESCDAIDKIMIVAKKEDFEELKALVSDNHIGKFLKIVEGGERRQNSVHNGILSLDEAKADDIVVIHNGVNPFIDNTTIKECIDAAKKYEAACVGFCARDTLKEIDEKGFVVKTLERNKIWQIQTPQAIRYGTAVRAFKKAAEQSIQATDDVMLVERLGKRVKMIECPLENIKLTLPNDMDFSHSLLKNSRIGFGMDSHRFIKEGKKPLMLGGALIEGERGFDANSDGDIILHALFNAISQAIGERSIGVYADKMCEQGIKDSKEYLKVMLDKIKERNYTIGNVGIMIEGKSPNITKNDSKIKESLCKILDIVEEKIGITATSGEELNAFGKGLGMQCFVVITLNKT